MMGSRAPAKKPDRGHPVRQRAKHALGLTERIFGTLFALRAQADKMSAIRFYLLYR